MARFILTDKHYLNVPGTKWEQKETSQQTGKQVRVEYQVGLYLDPKDPADWNYPQQQQIIVSTKRSDEYPSDIVFSGPPTQDMTALDDEGRKMIAAIGPKRDPFAELPNTVGLTNSEKILALLESKLSSAQAIPAPDDRVAKLEAEIAELKKLIKAPPKVVA